MIEKILYIDWNSTDEKGVMAPLKEIYKVTKCSSIKSLRAPELFSNDLIIIREIKNIEELINNIKYLNSLMIKNILIAIPFEWKKAFYEQAQVLEFIDVIYEPMLSDELLFYINKIKLESDNLYYQILNQMDLMALVLDADRRILYANAALLKETGYSINEVLGENIQIFKSNEHSLLFYDNLRQTLDSNLHWSGTFKNERKDGSLYWEDASVFKIKMNHEEVYIKISFNASRREKILSQQEKETKVASRVQRSLLPSKLETNNLKIDGFYKPLKNVSGDIYNWFKIKDNIYAVYLLDVVGHGVASALITTSAISIINNLLEKEYTLDVLLKKLNNKMINMYNLEDLSLNNYYTMAIGIIDLDKKCIKYANCGHPGIYMIHNQKLIELREGNFPIGLLSDKDYSYSEINYDSSVELFFFSDGLIEIDFDKKKGIKELKDALYRYIQTDQTVDLLSFLKTNLVDSRDADLHDDLTMTTVSISTEGETK